MSEFLIPQKGEGEGKKAIVILSGGLDSTTVTAMAANAGYELYCMTFMYGQKAKAEVKSAKKVAKKYKAKEHKIIKMDFSFMENTSLISSSLDVPTGQESIPQFKNDFSSTVVPSRNVIFLTYALAWAETIGATDIFIGNNKTDLEGYPDCRISTIIAFENLANFCTMKGAKQIEEETDEDGNTNDFENLEGPYTIHSPLANLTKAEVVAAGLKLKVKYKDTLSCYNPNEDGKPCGQCESCIIRNKAFEENGMTDPSV